MLKTIIQVNFVPRREAQNSPELSLLKILPPELSLLKILPMWSLLATVKLYNSKLRISIDCYSDM